MGRLPHLKSVAEFLAECNTHVGDRYYYRGVSKNTYDLVPRLLRQKNGPYDVLRNKYGDFSPEDLENNLLRMFIRYASQYFHEKVDAAFNKRDCNYFKWLSIAQHHGLPTLLVDWSLNPLVALFFSVQYDDGVNGKIFIMKLKSKDKRSNSTVRLSENVTEKSRSPLIVVPLIYAKRIESQAGRFTYSGYASAAEQSIEKYNEADRPWDSISSLIVNRDSKENIREELMRLQIHEGSMYQDLDGYARLLAGGGK